MLNSFRQSMAWVHTWFGLVLGFVLMVAFFFGALSVFDREIDRWAIPDTRFEPQPMPSYDNLLKQVFADLKPHPLDMAATAERVVGDLPAPETMPMVGLFAYNPPRCLQAIKEAGKLGQIKVCGFDEDDGLLQAIKDGHAYGTISQQPWKYGYQSVRVLKAILDNDNSVIPVNKFIDVGYKTVTAKNIDDFWNEKREMAALGAKKD